MNQRYIVTKDVDESSEVAADTVYCDDESCAWGRRPTPFYTLDRNGQLTYFGTAEEAFAEVERNKAR